MGMIVVLFRQVGAVVIHLHAEIGGELGANILEFVPSPKPLSVTCVPLAANAVAIPKPMPLVEPITSADVPLNM